VNRLKRVNSRVAFGTYRHFELAGRAQENRRLAKANRRGDGFLDQGSVCGSLSEVSGSVTLSAQALPGPSEALRT
jgi:hypothetical protein